MHRRLVSPRLRFNQPPVNPDPNSPTTAGGGLTQEQVDQIVQGRVAAAERKAREDAQAEIAAKLDGQSLDDILAAAKAARDAEDAQKTEAQKALDAANAAKAEADKTRADAKRELFDARLTGALQRAGAPADSLDVITVPGLTVDSTPDEIKTAVDAVKTRLPALFTVTPGQTADPGTPPPTPRPVVGAGSGGKAEFERRFPQQQ